MGALRWLQAISVQHSAVSLLKFTLLVRTRGARGYVLLLEIQTRWRSEKILSLAEYWLRFVRQYSEREIVPYMLLLTKNERAEDRIEYKNLTFSFHLIRLWLIPVASSIGAPPAVLPFIPLMEGGLELLEEAERRIYENRALDRVTRGELLTALAIFTGLRDFQMVQEILARRRDIIIESPTYDLIKNEGRAEGWKEGLREGHAEERLDIARRMKDAGMEEALILKLTELSPEELAAI